jgi:predicted enzyme related to lactoylglutathione lyase
MAKNPRLHGVVIDVPSAEHARAVEFWSAAIGIEPVVSEKYPDYAQFEDATPGCYLLVQSTGDSTSRVHLDFATEDRDGELDRLAALGAEEVTREHHWAVMRDPAGHPFCLCPVEGCME